MLQGDASELDHLTISGDRVVLPSTFDVTGLAAATVGVATLAASELQSTRGSTPLRPAYTDRREAGAAFVCERLFEPIDWSVPPLWDPIAGDYRARDGWIRLHTNYATHRSAVLRALGLDDPERAEVASVVATWSATELEQRVVDRGGCAAVMHTSGAWSAHPHGVIALGEPPVALRDDGTSPPSAALAPADRPLQGIRVLDLTRVIAGPVCTRFLAAWGADVVRIDPPGFAEVPALVPETSAGKRCTFLDLRGDEGRSTFAGLLARADVVVHGLRPGALEGLGLDRATIRASNPACVIAAIDAYGWTGPWSRRRGFDSLVQMSCGIAAAGAAAAGVDQPTPLPAQALDHATGFLTAAAVCRALTIRHRVGRIVNVSASLVGAANLLMRHPTPQDLDSRQPEWTAADTQLRATHWGAARAVPIPGRIDGLRALLTIPAGPLGRHDPAFDAMS